jgi:hypothetical protein
MITINGITRTAALGRLCLELKTLELRIGTRGYNRVGWGHEHPGFTIIGEFSPMRETARDRVVFAIYARER